MSPGANQFNSMKRIASLLLIGLAALTGGGAHYNMTLTNNNVITTRGKPKLDKVNHIYTYTDMAGKPGSVPDFRVKEIAPR